MRRNIIKIVFFIIISCIAAWSILAAFNEKKSDFNFDEEKIELLENAIIINSISEETETGEYHDIKDSFDEINENNQGEILYIGDLIIENAADEQNENTTKITDLLSELKKNDFRWHTTEYKINKGDNLWIISKKYNIDHRLIIKLNDITKPDRLNPGQKILIPNKKGIFITVIKGDTLSEICLEYNVSLKIVSEHNNISKNKIYIGRKIFLPDAEKKPVIKKTIVKNETYKVKNNSKIATKTKPENIAAKKKSFAWPLKGKITSGFGLRTHPISKKKKFHCGIDISVETGTPVKAAADGKIIYSGWKEGYGNLIVIEHEDNYITVYAHLNKMHYKKGVQIKKNQKIALSGATGNVTGPHLHFEIRKYLTPLNPMSFLR